MREAVFFGTNTDMITASYLAKFSLLPSSRTYIHAYVTNDDNREDPWHRLDLALLCAGADVRQVE